MVIAKPKSQNFTFLLADSPMLEKIISFAEAYLTKDQNGSLTKTQQWEEILAKRASAMVGIYTATQETLL